MAEEKKMKAWNLLIEDRPNIGRYRGHEIPFSRWSWGGTWAAARWRSSGRRWCSTGVGWTRCRSRRRASSTRRTCGSRTSSGRRWWRWRWSPWPPAPPGCRPWPATPESSWWWCAVCGSGTRSGSPAGCRTRTPRWSGPSGTTWPTASAPPATTPAPAPSRRRRRRRRRPLPTRPAPARPRRPSPPPSTALHRPTATQSKKNDFHFRDLNQDWDSIFKFNNLGVDIVSFKRGVDYDNHEKCVS